MGDAAAPLGDIVVRGAVGAFVASAIAIAAHRARSLSTSGAIAAVVVGTVCAAAGTTWAAMIITFFASSTALGRIRADVRERRIGGVVAKGGARDAVQVLANGGVFTAAALGHLVHPSPLWLALGGGALAAAASDTWATEIGSLARQLPRNILTWRTVPPGTSGGVTTLGTLASVGGAAFLGAIAIIGGWPTRIVAALVLGGIAGALADSLLGASAQVRRWCDRCDAGTEQPVHLCGTATRVSGGVPWIDNDTVNLLCVVVGGLVALLTTLFALPPA